jgi:hypothetical protein
VEVYEEWYSILWRISVPDAYRVVRVRYFLIYLFLRLWKSDRTGRFNWLDREPNLYPVWVDLKTGSHANRRSNRKTGKNWKTGGSRTEPVWKMYLIFLIQKIKKIHKLNEVNLIPLKVTLNDDQSSGRLQLD